VVEIRWWQKTTLKIQPNANRVIEHRTKSIIKFSFIVLIAIAIIGYAFFQSRNLINGPQIILKSPAIGATVKDPLVAIEGSVKNISFITLNDRQIFVDNAGHFKEELLLSPGYNVWEIEAKDKFGRIVSKKIELVLQGS
jgi:hypothetical protein